MALGGAQGGWYREGRGWDPDPELKSIPAQGLVLPKDWLPRDSSELQALRKSVEVLSKNLENSIQSEAWVKSVRIGLGIIIIS